MPELHRLPRWLHLGIVAIAVFAILYIAAGASLWHVDAPGAAATCPICHLAHMAAAPAMPAGNLPAPLIVSREASKEASGTYVAPTALRSLPRAPPL